MNTDFEITIIGAGAVGLAIALSLSEVSDSVLVIEKESSFGKGTSSRNSEVIHSGIYYEPNSLKARLCVEGRQELYSLSEKGLIETNKIGKLIVATTENEIPHLLNLYKNGRKNKVDGLHILSGKEASELEPAIHCKKALLSSETGIVSSHSLMNFLHRQSSANGVEFSFNTKVERGFKQDEGYKINGTDADGTPFSITTGIVVNSGGLYAHEIAKMFGTDIEKAGYEIHYARGCYSSYHGPDLRIKRLVYPVPSPEYLGIHLVMDTGGRIRFGPDIHFLEENREEYSPPDDIPSKFQKAVSRYLPQITREHLSPDFCGIRPKLSQSGEPSKDFIICEERDKGLPGLINLIGIESPGLTSAMAIGNYLKCLLIGLSHDLHISC